MLRHDGTVPVRLGRLFDASRNLRTAYAGHVVAAMRTKTKAREAGEHAGGSDGNASHTIHWHID
jgi:hypothetical protein